jgi:dihydrofolate reductase
MNNTPKLVASTTLTTLEWQNSRLLGGDLVAEITKLKQQPGKSISVSGSATLVRWLLRQSLLDELRLLVHPIVVGRGKRLFEGMDDRLPLKLLDSQTFSTGVLYLTYGPAGA